MGVWTLQGFPGKRVPGMEQQNLVLQLRGNSASKIKCRDKIAAWQAALCCSQGECRFPARVAPPCVHSIKPHVLFLVVLSHA